MTLAEQHRPKTLADVFGQPKEPLGSSSAWWPAAFAAVHSGSAVHLGRERRPWPGSSVYGRTFEVDHDPREPWYDNDGQMRPNVRHQLDRDHPAIVFLTDCGAISLRGRTWYIVVWGQAVGQWLGRWQ